MGKRSVVAAATFAILLALTGAASFAQQTGYYVLDGFGGVHAGGGAPAVFPQTPYFGFDIAKDIVYVPDGNLEHDGILVLDGFGGVHAGGAIKSDPIGPPTPYFGFNVARAITARAEAVTGWERVTTSCAAVPAGGSSGGPAVCPGLKKVTGGGALYFSDSLCQTPLVGFATSTRFLTFSAPSSDHVWAAGVFNDSGATIYYRRFAICVNAE
jgi:hypothetical protein